MTAMIGVLAVGVLFFLYLAYYYKENKFKEIERQQAMRRAVIKLNERSRHFSH